MVLGLALCGTFAYAQTCDFNKAVGKAKLQPATNPNIVERPVDYKASIFTKDTVLASHTFSTADWATITSGVVTATDMIDGAAATPHGQTADAQKWMRAADSADLCDPNNSIWGTTYASYDGWFRTAGAYMGIVGGIEDQDGFAFMWMNRENGTGVHNAYMAFPSVQRPADVAMIDVKLWQVYRKYYDQCYIDYKINGQWNSRAINVDGVDCGINDWVIGNYTYTMPPALAQQNNIEVRVRYFSDGTSGAIYGYMWAVDFLRIVGGGADRWFANNQHFLDGFYGTMPQNMEIPITWYGDLFNNGANPRTNVNLSLQHIDANLIGTPIANYEIGTVPANPTEAKYVFADERGFLAGEHANRPASGVFTPNDYSSESFSGCWWFGPNYASTNITGQGLQGLPVSELGQQFFAAVATSDGADDIAWDTIAYNVVDSTGGDANLAIAGYRWGHDNGIIPSGSRYDFGFNQEGTFVGEDCPRWSSRGYAVLLRYTTGNTIPENWVFRGMELVPQTVEGVGEIEGSQILPLMWEAADTALHLPLMDVETGFSTVEPYVVQISDLNDLSTGRIAPGETYKAVNLQFFNQPELKPNTSYYLGYELVADGKFGVAREQKSYVAEDGENTVSYRNDNNPIVANGYNQFTTSPYDVYMYDPGAGGYIATWNTDYAPMIRPIVGPRMSLPEFHINATCGDGLTIVAEDRETEICGEYAVAFQGSTPSVFIYPEGNFSPEYWASTDTVTGAYKINTITVDGQVVDIDAEYDDFSIAEGTERVYNADSSSVLMTRSYYAVTFYNINQNHNVAATANFHRFAGIDVAAANVCLGLQPNPATSSVKLNVTGVNGKVNCSIIDMSGRVIYNADINAEQQHVIDLSNVAAGAYFVRVTNDNFSKVEKLIVR